MEVALTHRTALVGEGYGISGGGFAEIQAFLGTEVGTIQRLAVEAYREVGEEFFGKEWQVPMEKTIPQGEFEAYAQPLDGYLVRTKDANQVHAPVYYAFPPTMAERIALANLPETPERTGQLQWPTLRWRPGLTKATLATDVMLWAGEQPLSWSVFHWQHEVMCVFQQLALLAAQKRLWNDRRA
jgi:hypothetical protein